MEVYGTTELTYHIEELIQDDTKVLILVSPYLQINDRLKSKMRVHFQNIENIVFLYRAGQQHEDKNKNDFQWLSGHPNIDLIPVPNLHAKVYMNQRRCIVTSLNLFEYSKIYNYEIGIELSVGQNRDTILSILDEISYMIDTDTNRYDFEKTIDYFIDYSFGSFFNECQEKFGFNGKGRTQERLENFSNWARTLVDFKKDELYKDDSAVLRWTDLGRSRYTKLKKHLPENVFERTYVLAR